MKVSKEQLSGSRWSLTVEIPAGDNKTDVENELKKLQRETTLPGFRRGKVPLSLIRQRFERSVHLDVMRSKLVEYYSVALKEADIGDPVATPEIEIVQLEPDKPLIFSAAVDVEPDIELASYDSLTVVKEIAEIGDEQVDKQIGNLQERHAVIQEQEDPAGPGSILEADVQELDAGFLPILGHKQEGVTIDLSRASEDFRNALLGVKAGESRNVTLVRPPLSPDEEKKNDFFQVSVKTVKSKELPELNDEFARQIGTDVEDLDGLRKAVHNELKRQIDAMSYQRVSHLLAHQVVDNSRLDVPQSMLKEYLDRLVEDARKSAENGQFDEDHIRNQFKDRAVWNLKWYLIRKKLAEKEGLKVEEDDLQQEFERLATASGKKLKQIQALYTEGPRRNQLEDDLMERKILQLLISRAKVIDRTVSFEEFFAKDNSGHEH